MVGTTDRDEYLLRAKQMVRRLARDQVAIDQDDVREVEQIAAAAARTVQASQILLFDLDADDRVTRSEVVSIVSRRTPGQFETARASQIDRVMAFDRDGDELISKEEMRHPVKSAESGGWRQDRGLWDV